MKNNNNTNFDAAKKFVEMKRRHGHESLSGPGSHLSKAQKSIELITNTINNYNIKSILDLGCGDFNWFRKVPLLNTNYEGWDACPQMIESNNEKYKTKNIIFFVKDIVLDQYPEVDLIICRDVLFHMQKSISKTILSNIKKKCKYFISTSFKSVNENVGIHENSDWGFYPINLDIEPFNLKSHEITHKSEFLNSQKQERFICLYKA